MNAKGTQENPYSSIEYQDLCEECSWEGGWVKIDNKTIYITREGKQEKDMGSLHLGSVDNPFSEDAYNEMHGREQWPGGYVLFLGDQEPTYMRSTESEMAASCGCGCGCGSGSDLGCGSGSGSSSDAYIEAGSTVIDTLHFRVDVKWSAGSTIKGNVDMSRFEIPSLTKTDESISVTQILISWSAAYTITLEIHYVMGNGDSAVRNHEDVTVKLYGI
ncbi:MAG: hypothetical protein ACI4UA_06345 [Bacteroidaceae bacterium]